MILSIREATENDVEIISDLIKQLAQFEKKNPNDVKITAEKIKKHGFGGKRYFHTLLAEYDEKPVGYALYFFSYAATEGAPILYLEDLFVEEKFQQRGIGKALLAHLAALALQNDCCRVEWHAFTWNQKALSFYENLGSIPKTDLVQIRLLGQSLVELASYSPA